MTNEIFRTDKLRDLIGQNLENPRSLEILFHEYGQDFVRVMDKLYEEDPGNQTLKFWHERIHFVAPVTPFLSSFEGLFILTAILVSGFIAKLPDFLDIDQEFFYSRNISFIVFPFMAAYFFIRQKAGNRLMVFTALLFVAACIYMNLLPNDPNSDPLVLANLHMPLVVWSLVGLAFSGDRWTDPDKRLSFLQFNGELAVMGAILGLAGGLMMAVTFALFHLISVNLEEFYTTYMVFWLLPALPLTATWLVISQPNLVSRISPVVARVFSPLVLVMLVVYLISMIVTGKDPYNNRDFLIMFNVLLVVVMALIVFSIVSHRENTVTVYTKFILTALCLVTVIVNCIAISSIIFRISEWGLTPNRLAVLGSNLLCMIHICMLTYRFFREFRQQNGLNSVRHTLAVYLPVYTAWAAIVVFVFPWVFRTA